MTNRQMVESRDLLPLLREAERALSSAAPEAALRYRVLAAVDERTRPPQTRAVASWLAPAVAIIAAIAFVGICIDDRSPAPPRNAALPQAPDEPSLVMPEPAKHDQDSRPADTADRDKPSATQHDDVVPPPVTTNVPPQNAPRRAPTPMNDRPAIPSAFAPRPLIPKSSPAKTPEPFSSTRSEIPLLGPWTSSTFGPAALPNPPRATLPVSGGVATSDDAPRKTRSNTPEIHSDSRPKNTPDKPPVDDEPADVHVFGIYEADGGAASIHVTRTGPVILVLSAYAATTWTVTAGPETEIRSIYLLGYEAQKLAAAPEAIVVHSSFEATGEFFGCGYEWPDKDPMSGCETGELLGAIKDVFGLSAASFHGCYAASSFKLGDDGAAGACVGGYPFSGFP